jgi:hypothetical protein
MNKYAHILTVDMPIHIKKGSAIKEANTGNTMALIKGLIFGLI